MCIESLSERRARIRREINDYVMRGETLTPEEQSHMQSLYAELRADGVPMVSVRSERHRRRSRVRQREGQHLLRCKDGTVRLETEGGQEKYDGLLEVAADLCDAKLAQVIQPINPDAKDDQWHQTRVRKAADVLEGRRYKLKPHELLQLGLASEKDVIMDDPLASQLVRAQMARQRPPRTGVNGVHS